MPIRIKWKRIRSPTRNICERRRLTVFHSVIFSYSYLVLHLKKRNSYIGTASVLNVSTLWTRSFRHSTVTVSWQISCFQPQACWDPYPCLHNRTLPSSRPSHQRQGFYQIICEIFHRFMYLEVQSSLAPNFLHFCNTSFAVSNHKVYFTFFKQSRSVADEVPKA